MSEPIDNDPRLAKVFISSHLFIDMMRFPKDFKIIEARYDHGKRALEIIFTQSDIPPLPEGCVIPYATARFSRIEIDPIRFDGWNK